MSATYPEYNGLNLTETAREIGKAWETENTFVESVNSRPREKSYVFFEGPPSANGLPGIHHAMGRSLKDIFCRYKTLQGFRVERKAGWDTHGLPVELGVEKELGITKVDIGTKISIEDYNKACKEAVMRYTDIWNDLTRQLGYWVDMQNPYITYESKYMESVWWLLAQLYSKNKMYKGYTIQPYSPAAGTGLSSAELNLPGCYKDVKDTTVVAQFKLAQGQNLPASIGIHPSEKFGLTDNRTFFLAWTTTPWTLPANTALCVGPQIDYVLVESYNPYTFERVDLILAQNLVAAHFGKGFVQQDTPLGNGTAPDPKAIPFYVAGTCKGNDLKGLRYEQLLPYATPWENADQAFQVITGDFVSTSDGTGIVHIAPTFGSDDAKVAADAGVPAMLVLDENEKPVPIVDLQGKYRPEMGEFAGMYVKNEYYKAGEAPEKSLDVQIAIKLKEENRAFKVEKYEHSYPHCWRTDKPVLYYPLDSWFIRMTDSRERMIELNNTINWKPRSTGEGRFGEWLKNANDWNLSRSRYWGIPIPIWSSEDGSERICIESAEMLKSECEKAVQAGLMTENPLSTFVPGDMSSENYARIDLHKNLMDAITLLSPSGQAMKREADLIDVWFDSGAMPYAQLHYPFENRELIDERKAYPADFIAEGVDQTRGWFYTLHAISTLVFDSVAYKNVVSNGLVLDKDGFKMSKSRGNAVDPFKTMNQYGPDATRWYMLTNAQPWDNLKFNEDGITEVQRKFFGTLYNTYSFFALYANIDGFQYAEAEVERSQRPEIDRWILSKLNSLIQQVEQAYENYEATQAGRLIQDFVSDQLSNWYVRQSRRRFWKGDYSADKISAYQTLYTCLETVAILGSPIAPFYMDRLYRDLNKVSGRQQAPSVHLASFPKANTALIDTDLEAQMNIAQQVSSLVLGLRKKEKIRVRQPLQKIMVPVLSADFARNIQHVTDLILSEVNVKELQLLAEGDSTLVKRIKPNFKTIGPKYGKQMKAISALVAQFTQEDIARIEAQNGWNGTVDGEQIALDMADFEISAQDIPGWLVASENGVTVALDLSITDELRAEGIARELVNRVQNLRKDSGLEVTDRIRLTVDCAAELQKAIANNQDYVCNEVLASEISFGSLSDSALLIDLVNEGDAKIGLVKD